MENINDETNEDNNQEIDASEPDVLSGEELLAESEKLTQDTDFLDDPDHAEETSEFTDAVDGEEFISDHAAAVDDTIDNGGAGNPPPTFTPPPAGMPVEDRLVRDPHASFGGVLSGIAHRFGWDVSLTRLAFVVLFLISGGFALPAYLLAWIIIPRARFWPPVVRNRSRSLSGRDIGIGLIALAVLVVVAIGSGDAAAVIVPLALIGGGVWLLVQNQRPSLATAGAPANEPTTFNFAPTDQAGSPNAHGSWTTPQMPAIQPTPVEPRSRGRKGVFLTIIGVVLLTPIIFGGLIIAAIAASDIDINFDEATRVVPVGVDDIPTLVQQDTGEYILDLTNTDLSPLGQDGAEPLSVSIDMDAGRIEVIVPSDVRTEVDAEIDAVGDVTVFGQNDDGFEPRQSVSVDDPELILDLSLDIGEIEVVRAD